MSATRPKPALLPPRIAGLADIARNLRWSWSRDAEALSWAIDSTLWHLTQHNPIALLRLVDPARLATCAADPAFLRRYGGVIERQAADATPANTWFARTYSELGHRPVAYFCAEFGLHNSVPIYSGGLGILAGDHAKAASDLGVPLLGVGLLGRRFTAQRMVREYVTRHYVPAITGQLAADSSAQMA